jgi:hypothetical protein
LALGWALGLAWLAGTWLPDHDEIKAGGGLNRPLVSRGSGPLVWKWPVGMAYDG